METRHELLAKQFILRDLRAVLNHWEEGKYTWKDLAHVSYELEVIFENWPQYEQSVARMLEPQQLPLFKDEEYATQEEEYPDGYSYELESHHEPLEWPEDYL